MQIPLIIKNNLIFNNVRIKFLYRSYFVQLVVFFLIMYGLFYLTIQLGTIAQNFLQHYCRKIFSALPYLLMEHPCQLIRICVFSCYQGITITLNFIPIMVLLLSGMHGLIASGYLSHITNIMDKFFMRFRLPGAIILPMVMAFNCNVTAIASTNFISNKPQRIISVVMMPFMPCNARLTIYLTFAAMFGSYGGLVIFSLYCVGILMAILTGMVVERYFFLQGNIQPRQSCIKHKSHSIKTVSLDIYLSIKSFIMHAGSMILLACFIINMLFYYLKVNDLLQSVGLKISYLLTPLGLGNNWQAAISLISGIVGKEFLLISLNTLNNINGVFADCNCALKNVTSMFANHYAAYAYLVFTLLYVPCISVLSILYKDLGLKWVVFATVWPTILAYCIAVVVYNLFFLKISLLLMFVILMLVYGLTLFAISSINFRKYKTIPVTVIVDP